MIDVSLILILISKWDFDLYAKFDMEYIIWERDIAQYIMFRGRQNIINCLK